MKKMHMNLNVTLHFDDPHELAKIVDAVARMHARMHDSSASGDAAYDLVDAISDARVEKTDPHYIKFTSYTPSGFYQTAYVAGWGTVAHDSVDALVFPSRRSAVQHGIDCGWILVEDGKDPEDMRGTWFCPRAVRS